MGSSDPATRGVLWTHCGVDLSLRVTLRALWSEARMTDAGVGARYAGPTVISVRDDTRGKSYISWEPER